MNQVIQVYEADVVDAKHFAFSTSEFRGYTSYNELKQDLTERGYRFYKSNPGGQYNMVEAWIKEETAAKPEYACTCCHSLTVDACVAEGCGVAYFNLYGKLPERPAPVEVEFEVVAVIEPAAKEEANSFEFCGEVYQVSELPKMSQEDFDNLYDQVIDYGSDLVERAADWSAATWAKRKDWYNRATAYNTWLLDIFGREADRRKRLVRWA